MKTILWTLTVSTLLTSTSFASTYAICGKKISKDGQNVEGYELELSAESDKYAGPVGKNWNLKLGSQKSDWLPANKNIVAKSQKANGDVVVDITIATGRSATGIVGTAYRFIGVYADYPVLEKYTIGGFAGTVKVGTFECVSGND